MKAFPAVAATSVLLAIALAATAPASLLDARFAALSAGHVRLADASGTLWNGSGELVLLPGAARRAVTWHVAAWPLVLGELRGNAALGGEAEPRTSFLYGPRSAELRGFDLALPMASLLEAAGPGALARAGGELALHVERFVRSPESIGADATLQWRDASLPSPRAGLRIALGDVRLDLRGSGTEIAGPLANRGGDVELTGRVAISSLLIPRVDAMVRPRAGLDADRAQAIAAALSLLGTGDGQGGYRIVWTGS